MKTKRWWISWYEPVGEDADYRPLKWPLSKSVVKYWCTGYTGDGCAATLCALIEAPTESKAKAAIKAQGWKPREWRFCEEKAADWRPGDRFPWDAAAGSDSR